MTQINVFRLIRLTVVVASIFVSLLVFFYVAKYTYPFIIALIIAFILNPIVNFFEGKLNLNRPVSVFLSISIVLALITSIITLLIVELINGTTYLAEHIPVHFRMLVSFFQSFITDYIMPLYQTLASLVNTLEPSQQNAVIQNIQNIGEEIASTGASLLQSILQKVHELLVNLPNYITVLIVSLLGTFFISKDWYKLTNLLNELAPKPFTKSGRDVVNGLKRALVGFIKAQLTLISITALIVLAGLWILRVEYAVTIAVITGFIDLLPYLGTGLVFIPWILYMFLTGNYFLTIGLTILYLTVIVQRQLMEPKILSDNIGLNPLATLVALFAGFKLWGFAGLIIGPVILVIINTLLQTGVFRQVWIYIKGEH